MGWSTFWVERAHQARERRVRVYGAEAPPAVARALESKPPVGFGASLRLALYVLFGSPLLVLGLFVRYLTDRDTPKRRQRIAKLAAELREVLTDSCRLMVHYFERRLYAHDLARIPPLVEKALYRTTPLVVVQPRSERDIVATLRHCGSRGLAVFPRGIASSAFGGVLPTTNGVVLDLSFMRKTVAIDAEKRTATVQPGVRWADLAARAEPLGLAPMTTPSSRFSTVGGWAATGGRGLEGYRYGLLRDALVAARVALPAGEVLELGGEDERLDDFVGTEGQLGVFAELTLRLRPKPSFSCPRLVYVSDESEAFELVDRLVEHDLEPSHVAFLDQARMAEMSQLVLHRAEGDEPVVEAKDALLVHFDDAAELQRFDEVFEDVLPALDRRQAVAARYVWTDRYFPLKAQRLGPNLLASEVVMPRDRVVRFVRGARRLAGRFGAELAIDVTVGCGADGPQCVVIASFPCDETRRLNYLLLLLLAQLLTHFGVRLKGHPYGTGIWNSAFLSARYPGTRRRALVRRKRQLDERGILNPGKFFAVRTRFWGLPGIIFRSGMQRTGLWIALLSSPLLAVLARVTKPDRSHRWTVPSPTRQRGRQLLTETAARCTRCGACVSSCPAYLVTSDELVTARAKLLLVQTLADGDELTKSEAASPFQCLRCGLCEEVCQTNLPLRDCYDALEGWLERRYERPAATLQSFAEAVDARRQWVADTFGLAVPSWTPPATSDDAAAPKPRSERRAS